MKLSIEVNNMNKTRTENEERRAKNLELSTNWGLRTILLLAVIFMMSSTYALGITPGRTSVDFSPDFEKEVTFSVVNTEGKDMDIAFSVEGDLADYVNISNEVVSFSSEEGSKSFKYRL